MPLIKETKLISSKEVLSYVNIAWQFFLDAKTFFITASFIEGLSKLKELFRQFVLLFIIFQPEPFSSVMIIMVSATQ